MTEKFWASHIKRRDVTTIFSWEIYNMFVHPLNSYFVGSTFLSHSSRTSQEGLQHGLSQYRWHHYPSHSVFQSYVFRVWDYLKSEGARPGEYCRCETSWSPQSRIVAIITTNMWARTLSWWIRTSYVGILGLFCWILSCKCFSRLALHCTLMILSIWR